MIRKITSDFKFIDSDRIEVKIIDNGIDEVNTTICQYDLSLFDNITDIHFYNKMIDDFDAEYDDDLALTIMRMISLIIKDYKKEEDEEHE